MTVLREYVYVLSAAGKVYKWVLNGKELGEVYGRVARKG